MRDLWRTQSFACSRHGTPGLQTYHTPRYHRTHSFSRPSLARCPTRSLSVSFPLTPFFRPHSADFLLLTHKTHTHTHTPCAGSPALPRRATLRHNGVQSDSNTRGPRRRGSQGGRKIQGEGVLALVRRRQDRGYVVRVDGMSCYFACGRCLVSECVCAQTLYRRPNPVIFLSFSSSNYQPTQYRTCFHLVCDSATSASERCGCSSKGRVAIWSCFLPFFLGVSRVILRSLSTSSCRYMSRPH